MIEDNRKDRLIEIQERDELFNSIKKYYTVHKEVIDKNKDSVFSEIKHLITKDLIDNTFRKYYNNQHKILEAEREKGVIVYIDFLDFEEMYKKEKLPEVFAKEGSPPLCLTYT